MICKIAVHCIPFSDEEKEDEFDSCANEDFNIDFDVFYDEPEIGKQSLRHYERR